MIRAYAQLLATEMAWQEALSVAFESGLSSPITFEWLIDAAEREVWSGPW